MKNKAPNNPPPILVLEVFPNITASKKVLLLNTISMGTCAVQKNNPLITVPQILPNPTTSLGHKNPLQINSLFSALQNQKHC